MQPNHKTNLFILFLASWSLSPTAAQNMSVDISMRAAKIPKVCQSVVPASIEGRLDITALTREAICKGAGDMLLHCTRAVRCRCRPVWRRAFSGDRRIAPAAAGRTFRRHERVTVIV
jgi:hypothetical protein